MVSCARLRCQGEPSTDLLVDARVAEARLIDLTDEGQGVMLCTEHADRVTAPVGWSLIDDREHQLVLFDDKPLPQPGLTGYDWHERYEDTSAEPANLAASSPLLSRAFRGVRADDGAEPGMGSIAAAG